MINKHLVEGATLPVKRFTYICLLTTMAVWSLACVANVVWEIMFYDAELEETLCLCNMMVLEPPPLQPPCFSKESSYTVNFYQNSSGEIKWVPDKELLPIWMSVKTAPKGVWTPLGTKKLSKNWRNLDSKTLYSIGASLTAGN